MRNVRVFVSSPGDLKAEREIAAAVIRAFNDRSTIRDRYKFSAYLYEEHAPALTGEGPQDVIDQQMLRPSEADMVVCMLWARFGTPLNEINPDTGKPYGSGTEYEFYEAYRAYRRSKRPAVLLYRCTRPAPAQADPQQIANVIAFFDRFSGPKAPLRGLYKSFNSTDDFRRILSTDLDSVIANWDRPSQRLLDQVLRPFWPVFVLLLIGIIALAIVLPPAIRPVPPTPTPIRLDSRSFNVAIAPFAVDTGTTMSAADVKSLSDVFYNAFRGQLDRYSSSVIALWSPDLVSQAGSDKSLDIRDEPSARQLVERLRQPPYNAQADMVIYGVIKNQNGTFVVQPYFTVVEKSLELREVYGRFDLDQVVPTGDIDQLGNLRVSLATRARLMANMVYGLSLLAAQDFKQAGDTFTQAIQQIDAAEMKGRAFLYVLRANTSFGSYNATAANTVNELYLHQAEADFIEARKYDPNYARALVGLASIRYLRAQAVNPPDSEELKAVLVDYDRAANVDQPPGADIPVKVALGKGQVFTLLGDYDAAQQAFNMVIAAYGPDNQRVRELAAQAQAGLGFIATELDDYDKAITAYEAAASLTRLPMSKPAFESLAAAARFLKADASGKGDDAVKACDSLVAQTGQAVDIARLLFDKAQRSDKAIGLYQCAIRLNLTDAPALAAELWAALGFEYQQVNQIGDAIRAYQQAVQLAQNPTRRAQFQAALDSLRPVSTPTPQSVLL